MEGVRNTPSTEAKLGTDEPFKDSKPYNTPSIPPQPFLPLLVRVEAAMQHQVHEPDGQ